MKRLAVALALLLATGCGGVSPESLAEKVGCTSYVPDASSRDDVETGTCTLETERVIVATFKSNDTRDIWLLGQLGRERFVATERGAVGASDALTLSTIRGRLAG